MAIEYKNVVPWGRSFDEYLGMFSLSGDDLQKTILGCADGPAGFNARMHQLGHRVISCDPVYNLSRDEIEARIRETFDAVMEQTARNREKFLWETISSPETLGTIRMEAMTEFLRDYDAGKQEGRYVAGELPELPFSDRFDLVLCANFLFLYSDHLSLEFHRKAINEMGRIGREIRIFPIVDMTANRSPHLDGVLQMVMQNGWSYREIEVDYEFLKNGNQMVQITIE